MKWRGWGPWWHGSHHVERQIHPCMYILSAIKMLFWKVLVVGSWWLSTDNDVALLPTPLCWWLANVTLVALQGGSNPHPALCKQLSPSLEWWSQKRLISKSTEHSWKLYSSLGKRGLRLVRVVGRMGSTLQVDSGLFGGIDIATVCCHAPHFSVNELFQSLRLSVCSIPLHQFLNT